ncbi:MAG: type IV pilus modification PilV family protein [Planctomycetota bacterium]|jgi:Tfp pilus assembly protein PilV
MPGKLINLDLRRVKPQVRAVSQNTGHAPLGLTLTEVVVASALLVIAIVPILKALTSAHVTGSIIERRTRSLLLAQAKLDEIRARSIYNYAANFTENHLSLDGSYFCSVVDSAKSADLRQISVSVGYDSNGDTSLTDAEIEITLTTLLARRW